MGGINEAVAGRSEGDVGRLRNESNKFRCATEGSGGMPLAVNRVCAEYCY